MYIGVEQKCTFVEKLTETTVSDEKVTKISVLYLKKLLISSKIHGIHGDIINFKVRLKGYFATLRLHLILIMQNAL
jgi:hypothetical protein